MYPSHSPASTLRIMIRTCTDRDLLDMYTVINDAARAYRGVIPADRWKEPYMSLAELQHEIADGVRFWGYELHNELVGVMGLQNVLDVALIRHAYVLTAYRNQGIGGQLLAELRAATTQPILVGTWAAARWAVRFYEKHGFRLVSEHAKERLLRKYWSIPARQIEESVVLAESDAAHWE
jgi:GNAT superfamily N-acetyltransferase